MFYDANLQVQNLNVYMSNTQNQTQNEPWNKKQ